MCDVPHDCELEMTELEGRVELRDDFADLTDPRRGKVTHPLLNIITIAVWARGSIKNKRLNAGWKDEYLFKVLPGP